jgi:hypothetical protein
MARDPDDRYATAGDLRAALLAAERDELDETNHEGGFGFAALGTAPSRPVPPPAEKRGFAKAERGWLVPAALVVLVGVALGVAGVLFSRTDTGRRLLGGPTTTEVAAGAAAGSQVPIAEVQPFDPEGDDEERNDLAGLAIDGQADTEWQTEGYRSRNFGELKDGVGLVLGLAEPQDLRALRIVSPLGDWTAEVFVAGENGGELADWGEPVTVRENVAAGEVVFDLGGRTGRYVMLWFTRPAEDGDRYRVRIAEAVVEA